MAWILFGAFILLLIVGVPIAFSVAGAAGVAMFVGVGPQQGMKLISRMFESTNSFSLIAVPFFILAGDLLAKGKLSKMLVEFCESFLGWVRGGLSIVSVLAGMLRPWCLNSRSAATRWIPLPRWWLPRVRSAWSYRLRCPWCCTR